MHDPNTTTGGPGRPKDPAKRMAILDAAKRLFVLRGYDKSSMAAIAAEAGVSKLTLYSHFADKEALFVAAIQSKCEEQLPSLFLEPNQHSPIRDALLKIGHGFYALVNSQEAIALKRLMVAQAGENPSLVRLFYEAGPQQVENSMEKLLASAHQNGTLHAPQPRRAAEHFFSLIMGVHHYRLLAGIERPQSAAAIDRHVNEVVTMFLRLHSI